MTDLAGALAELYARVPRGMELGLDKMLAACRRFDHPERKFKAIHVAGTNGKGSVCAMVEAIARAAGSDEAIAEVVARVGEDQLVATWRTDVARHRKRTGLYTSPHLAKFSERIRIDGEPISDEDLERILSDVLKRAPELSFFEAATMTAFVAFAEANVDIAIIEVGIGGRLDATNVIPSPLVTAITRIAFDHMDKLGSSLREIAVEKAGIAKHGVPLILGPIEGEALKAIEEVAAKVGAPITHARGSAMVGRTNLRGAHQDENLNVAIGISFALGWQRQDILNNAIQSVSWPGRLERIETKEGLVLLDAAHNPDGAAALARYLREPKSDGMVFFAKDRVALVFGTLADKAWPEMIDLLAPLANHRVYTTPKGRAPTPPETIASRFAGKTAADPIEALAIARELVGSKGLVVVAGSIFLVGELRSHLLGLPRDPVVAL
jgi:dihydrofolate synthase / folylpolyglutamate synthase